MKQYLTQEIEEIKSKMQDYNMEELDAEIQALTSTLDILMNQKMNLTKSYSELEKRLDYLEGVVITLDELCEKNNPSEEPEEEEETPIESAEEGENI